jgi:hypothetical protein
MVLNLYSFPKEIGETLFLRVLDDWNYCPMMPLVDFTN